MGYNNSPFRQKESTQTDMVFWLVYGLLSAVAFQRSLSQKSNTLLGVFVAITNMEFRQLGSDQIMKAVTLNVLDH